MPTKPLSHADRQRALRPASCGRAVTDRDFDIYRKTDPVQVEADRLRNSWRWRQVRAKKIRRDPLCETCRRQGLVVPARDVNHKTPVRELVERGETHRVFSMENLESLCRSHHNEATARERRERRAR